VLTWTLDTHTERVRIPRFSLQRLMHRCGDCDEPRATAVIPALAAGASPGSPPLSTTQRASAALRDCRDGARQWL